MKRNLFRRALACLCLCAVLSGRAVRPGPGRPASGMFPPGHWAADAISQCVTQGWFQGKSADTFGVGQPMTRSAFAVVLSRFFGWQEQRRLLSDFFRCAPRGMVRAALPGLL